MEPNIRVVRVVIYEGPYSWVTKTVATAINGVKFIDKDKKIFVTTIQNFPLEIPSTKTEKNNEQ